MVSDSGFDLLFSQSVSSVAQLCPTLQTHESQHARPPCPSPTPGVYSNSCPSSQWCHPAISSSVIPFSSCPQSLMTNSIEHFFQWFLATCLSLDKYVSKSFAHFKFNLDTSIRHKLRGDLRNQITGNCLRSHFCSVLSHPLVTFVSALIRLCTS